MRPKTTCLADLFYLYHGFYGMAAGKSSIYHRMLLAFGMDW